MSAVAVSKTASFAETRRLMVDQNMTAGSASVLAGYGALLNSMVNTNACMAPPQTDITRSAYVPVAADNEKRRPEMRLLEINPYMPDVRNAAAILHPHLAKL